MIKTIKSYIRRTILHFIPSLTDLSSYSQAGEDAVIDFLLQQVDLYWPRYLELGSHHPISCNNTYRFYGRGARGVLVEPNRDIIPTIKRIRPGDTVLNIGVSEVDMVEQDFYTFEISQLNTFNKKEAYLREKSGTYKIQSIVKLPTKSINTIIKENFTNRPDLLSIDIEGLDYIVLRTLDFDKYPIPIICAETCEYSENHIKGKNMDIGKLLRTKGYFVYADTYINTIYVNRKWFNAAGKIASPTRSVAEK